MPQELQLPDGRILVIPDNITLDQRAALRNKLGAQYADVRTGQGMEQRAQQQARQTLTGTGQEGRYDVTGRKVAGPKGEPLSYMERAEQEQTGRQTKLAERLNRASRAPTPVTGAASVMYAPMAAARSLVGSKVGSTLGQRVGGQYGEVAGGLVGGAVGAMPGPRNLAQRVLRGPGGTGEVTINPMTAATRELEATVPRNEPPGARQEMQMDLGQQQADAITRENLTQRAATRQAARAGKAVPVAQSPGPYRGPRTGTTAGTAEGAPATDNITAPAAPNLSQRASKRLVLTPEEAASQDRLQQIAEEEARRRGMRSAAWGQQGQP